jgi:hypothetical protein
MRPTFVLSLDTELVWGSLDHTTPEEFATRYPDVRGVIAELITMLRQYEISATWAIVGHLFLESCTGQHGDVACGVAGSRSNLPLFYGDDILAMIKAARPVQEIGSHSFVHKPYDGPLASVSADLEEVVKVGRENALELRSFVFPRNVEGHHELLARKGFMAYRGADPTWYRSLTGPAGRLAHLFDQALSLPPPVSSPAQTLDGLWNVPGSMLLLSRRGARRFIPLSARVRKASRGLHRAVNEEKAFHLWFHPFNMAVDRCGMFSCLDRILKQVAELRSAGHLEVKTMGDVASEMAGTRSDG